MKDKQIPGTIEILKQLVAIPSFVDDKNDETKLAFYIKSLLRLRPDLEVTEQLVEGKRSNLLALPNGKKAKILFLGHMDTVLPKLESTKPFSGVVKNERLYGLGAVDMKAGLAVMLHLALTRDDKDVGFIFSVDEEFDFKGVRKLISLRDIKPEVMINVEPTDNLILNGCRGITEFSFQLLGKSAHAGRKNLGINAIEKAVEMSHLLQKEINLLGSKEVQSSVNLAYLEGGILEKMENGKPVLGKMGNIVPNFAQGILEIRIANPRITQGFVESNLSKFAKKLKVKIQNVKFKFYLGSMFTPKANLVDFVDAVEKGGYKATFGDLNKTGYFELQILQQNWGGIGIMYGPGPAKMCHTADEYVTLDSVKQTEKVLNTFLDSRSK